jgi:hypothetical protein
MTTVLPVALNVSVGTEWVGCCPNPGISKGMGGIMAGGEKGRDGAVGERVPSLEGIDGVGLRSGVGGGGVPLYTCLQAERAQEGLVASCGLHMPTAWHHHSSSTSSPALRQLVCGWRSCLQRANGPRQSAAGLHQKLQQHGIC